LAGIVLIAVLLREQIIAQIESATHRTVPMDQVTPEMISFALLLVVAAAVTCLTAWILAMVKRINNSLAVLAGGMAVFLGIAVWIGLPAVDSAYVFPLHR